MPYWPPDSPPESPAQMPASSWDIQAPYAPGSPQPVRFPGDPDPGGRDDVAGDVAGAKAGAMARQSEQEGDTHQQGSTIGDVLMLPPGGLDPGAAAAGETEPTGAFYTPPRNY